MSNRQLGWDDQQIHDRLSPPDIDEMNKEQFNQQQAEDNKDRVLDSNPHTHSKKSDK